MTGSVKSIHLSLSLSCVMVEFGDECILTNSSRTESGRNVGGGEVAEEEEDVDDGGDVEEVMRKSPSRDDASLNLIFEISRSTI